MELCMTGCSQKRKPEKPCDAWTFLTRDQASSQKGRIMKKLSVLLLALLSISPAYADRGGWHGRGVGWHEHGWGGGWVGPALIGGMVGYSLAYPYRYPYPYPYAYPYPYPVYQQTYPVYTEPTPVQPAAPVWYYCDSAKGYYPYVPSCPEPWRPVPSQPPPSSH